MATINGSCDNSRYSLTCEYSYTQNVSANTSTITANVYLNGNGYTTSSSYWSCVINGVTVTSNKNASIGGKTLLGSRTWTVNHASDGTCRTDISFSYSNGLSSSGTYTTKSGSGRGTVTLTTIPRGSSISLNRSSAILGSDSITISLNRASNNYTHKIQLYFGSYGALLAEGVGTSYTFTPNISLCSQIPNATSGTATIKVQTMNGNSWVAETSKTITFNVPDSVVPSISSISLTGKDLLGSVYVAGKSTVTAKINGASGSHGSTIKSYSINGVGVSSSSDSMTSGLLSAGTFDIVGKVTDSRGRTATKKVSITVHSYNAPSLSIEFYRCNSDGTKNDQGVYARVRIMSTVVNVGNANVNIKQNKIEYKTATSNTWSTKRDWTNNSAYVVDGIVDLGGGWNNTVTYDIRVSVKDSYNTVTATASIGTIACLYNIERDGVGVKKVHERGALDVGGTVYSTDSFVATKNGKDATLGTGSEDVFIKNSKSGKCLQLKDDGILRYDNKKVYHEGHKPTYSDVGALPMDSPCFTGNLVQSRSGYAWVYHINADIGSLNIAPCNADGNNDWAKQFLLKRDGDVEISKNLKVKDIFMQRCWLYDVARINAGGSFDIHATGTGINGGPLYLNGNSTIKSVVSASETPVKYKIRQNLDEETQSVLDDVIVVSTSDGLRMIPKVEKCNDEGQLQGVDLVEIISALKIENEKIKQSLNDVNQRVNSLENLAKLSVKDKVILYFGKQLQKL